VLGSTIQGAGATRQTLVLDAMVVLCLQIPASLLVVFGWHLGPQSLWRVIAGTYFTYAILYVWNYRRGRYLRTAIPT
jgi:Na+-driven multidrug efflux pump